MATIGGITAGKAFVEIEAVDKTTAVLKNVSKKMADLGQSMVGVGKKVAAAGMAITGPLAASVKMFTSMGDTLAKASTRTGVAVEALSELAYAAEQSGTNLPALETGIRNMQRKIVEAAQGSQEYVDALAAIGLTAADLEGKLPDEQFMLIADRLSQVEDTTLRTATAMDIFGRAGTQLMPLMIDGAAGIELLRQRARELGLQVSTKDANAAVVLGDTWDDVLKVLKQTAFTIGATLAPAIQQMSNWLLEAVQASMKWIKQNQELVILLAKVGAATAAIGTAIIAVGVTVGAIGKIVVAVNALRTALLAANAALGPLGLALSGIALFSMAALLGELDAVHKKIGDIIVKIAKAHSGFSKFVLGVDVGAETGRAQRQQARLDELRAGSRSRRSAGDADSDAAAMLNMASSFASAAGSASRTPGASPAAGSASRTPGASPAAAAGTGFSLPSFDVGAFIGGMVNPAIDGIRAMAAQVIRDVATDRSPGAPIATAIDSVQRGSLSAAQKFMENRQASIAAKQLETQESMEEGIQKLVALVQGQGLDGGTIAV